MKTRQPRRVKKGRRPQLRNLAITSLSSQPSEVKP